MVRYCDTCGFRDADRNICLLRQIKIDPINDFCSNHKSHVLYCEKCHNLIFEKPHFVMDGPDKHHILCHRCAAALSSCLFCNHCSTCDFETNPSPLPKIVQKQIQRGPIITVTNIKNPDRIAITCKNGCPCYHPENGCMRQFYYCGNIEHIFSDIIPEEEVANE